MTAQDGMMGFLAATDALPLRPSRVIVAGSSGAGKTHMVARIAAALDLQSVELDALHHGPAWVKRPSFEADVAQFAAGPRWVCEWQYKTVRPLLAARADLCVWLDHNRARVLWQVTSRTILRRIRREQLWNGNAEGPLSNIFRDRDHVVRYAWRTYPDARDRVVRLASDQPDLPIVRLTGRANVDRWVAGSLANAAKHKPAPHIARVAGVG